MYARIKNLRRSEYSPVVMEYFFGSIDICAANCFHLSDFIDTFCYNSIYNMQFLFQ